MRYPRTERQAEFMALADGLAARFAETAAEYDRANTFPFEHFRLLREAGYLALTVPVEYGGRGADPLEMVLAQSRLARGDGSTALAAAMHLNYLARLGEARFWPEALFERVCRDVADNGALINVAHSEPELGSPSRGGLPGTTAVRTSNGWRLNGHKRWTSLAPALTWVEVLAAVVEEGKPLRRGNFLVPANTPGLRVVETWDNLGMRATASHDVLLEDVEVPFEALLPPAGSGGTGRDASGWGPLVVSSVYLGVATAARDAAVRYARERKPIGMDQPIAALPAIQQRVAEIQVLLLQAETVLLDIAEQWTAEPDNRVELAWRLAAAKHTVSNHAIRITDLALRVAGSAGLARTLPLERYFRDARTSLNQPPIDDAALIQIGRAALGV